MTDTGSAPALKRSAPTWEAPSTDLRLDFPDTPDRPARLSGLGTKAVAALAAVFASWPTFTALADGWQAGLQLTANVALGGVVSRGKRRHIVPLAEAREIALRAVARSEQEYARLADREAQVEQSWEEIG